METQDTTKKIPHAVELSAEDFSSHTSFSDKEEKLEKVSALQKMLMLAFALLMLLQMALCVWVFYVSSGCAWRFDMQGFSVANGIARCSGDDAAAMTAPVQANSEEVSTENVQGIVLTETLSETQRGDVASFFSSEVEVQFAESGALEGVIVPRFVDTADESFDFSSYKFILVPVQQAQKRDAEREAEAGGS